MAEEVKIQIDTKEAEKSVERLTVKLNELKEAIATANEKGDDTTSLVEEYNNTEDAVNKLKEAIDNEKVSAESASLSNNKLSNSVDNLATGTNTASNAIDGVAKSAAMFGKTGQELAGTLGRIKGVIDVLKKATQEYKKNQDQAKKSSDAMNASTATTGNAASSAAPKVRGFSTALKSIQTAVPIIAALAAALGIVKAIIDKIKLGSLNAAIAAADKSLVSIQHNINMATDDYQHLLDVNDATLKAMQIQGKSEIDIANKRKANNDSAIEGGKTYSAIIKDNIRALNDELEIMEQETNANNRNTEYYEKRSAIMDEIGALITKHSELIKKENDLLLDNKKIQDEIANIEYDRLVGHNTNLLNAKLNNTKWAQSEELKLAEATYEQQKALLEQQGKDTTNLTEAHEIEVQSIKKKYAKLRRDQELKENVELAQAKLNRQLMVTRDAQQEELALLDAQFAQQKQQYKDNEESIAAITQEYQTKQLEIKSKYAQAAIEASRALYESEAALDSEYYIKSQTELNNRILASNEEYKKEAEMYKSMLDNKLIQTEEYDEALKALYEQNTQEIKALEDNFIASEEERFQSALDAKYAIAQGSINQTYAVALEELEHQYKSEIAMAEKTGADKLLIEKKYTNARKKLGQQRVADEIAATGAVVTQITSAMTSLFGENKKIQGAAIIINGIMGAAGGLAQAIATYPAPYGPILGAATAAAEIASAAASYKQLMSTSLDSPGTGTAPSASTSEISTSLDQNYNNINASIGTGLVLSEGLANMNNNTTVSTVLVVDDVTYSQQQQSTVNRTAVI